MRTSLFCFLTIGTALSVPAQFYPETQACWYGTDDDGGPPNYDVIYQMGLSPDTLINSVVYKRIKEYRDYAYTRTYWVRSDPNGRGYAYLPDSAAEYLTGDLAAQEGDTVHDVLWSNTYQSGIDYFLADMVVDSVVSLSNAGVTVTRHWVTLGVGWPSQLFWQAGMGLRTGPMLELSGAFWSCIVVDTVMFGGITGLPGPIGVEPCSPFDMGSGFNERSGLVELKAVPNPSSGLFEIAGGPEYPFTVINSQDKVVLTGTSSLIDLRGHPVGLYTAIVSTMHGQHPLRLVVLR